MRAPLPINRDLAQLTTILRLLLIRNETLFGAVGAHSTCYPFSVALRSRPLALPSIKTPKIQLSTPRTHERSGEAKFESFVARVSSVGHPQKTSKKRSQDADITGDFTSVIVTKGEYAVEGNPINPGESRINGTPIIITSVEDFG